MIRRGVAGAILGVSLLVASLAWWGFLALRTVFEPDRSTEIAAELLENDDVVEQLASNLGLVIEAALPPEVPLPAGLASQVAMAALADPEVRQIILTAFTDTHRAFLGEGEAPTEVDLTPVAASARAALVSAAPSLAASIPESVALVVPLPTEHIPDASPVETFLERTVPVLALLAIAGAVVALVFTSHRSSILRRAGVWALGTTAVYLVLGLLVPKLVRAAIPAQGEVLAALLTAVLRATVAPSVVLGFCGAGMLVASFAWPDAEVSRTRPRRVPRDRPRREPGPPRRGARRVDRATRAASPQSLSRSARAVHEEGPPLGFGGVAGDWSPPARPGPTPAPAAPSAASPGGSEMSIRSDPRPAAAGSGGALGAASALAPSSEGGSSAVEGRPAPVHAIPAADLSRPGGDSGDARLVPAEEIAAAEADDTASRYRPSWNPDHGWVLDPYDPRPRPTSARWVEGVGWVVPGPPPGRS